MRPIVRALVLASALTGSSPLFAEDLVVSDLKAFSARMAAATQRCDADTVVDRVSPLATISGTGFAQGDMRMFRMNKAQYGQSVALSCTFTSYAYERTNEQISIDGDQATITADVAETIVHKGQRHSVKYREKAIVELIDGKLMLVQLLANLTEQNVAAVEK